MRFVMAVQLVVSAEPFAAHYAREFIDSCVNGCVTLQISMKSVCFGAILTLVSNNRVFSRITGTRALSTSFRIGCFMSCIL